MEKHPKRGPKVQIFISNGLKKNSQAIEMNFGDYFEVRAVVSDANPGFN